MALSIRNERKNHTSLSHSSIWKLQKEFYAKEGIKAWNAQVPFYITTNPYIANCYAEIVAEFMQDQRRQCPENASDPFYILELGAGSGCFGFYFIKALVRILKTTTTDKPYFKYIMTDFAESNIKYWTSHANLQPYIKEGYIDFAVYDTDLQQPIHLLHSDTILLPSLLKHPLIIIANYVFDSIPQDAFQVQKGRLLEQKVERGTLEEERKGTLNAVELIYSSYPTKLPYYQDPIFDSVLENYLINFNEAWFLFPIGALRCLRSLLDYYGDQLLLLTTDRGYFETASFHNPGNISVSRHASISFLVNFHAIAEYLKQKGGTSFCSCAANSIITLISMVGLRTSAFKRTLDAISRFTQVFSPGDFFNISKLIRQQNDGLASILSALRLSHWDPHIFNGCLDEIIEKIDKADYEIEKALLEGMKKIENNFYYIPGQSDTFFNQGFFCQKIGEYTEAINYYTKSLLYFGESYNTYCNIGICYHNLGQFCKALDNLKAALKLDPFSGLARKWLARIMNPLNNGIVRLEN